MEMMLKMSESWIVDDDVSSSSSDGGDLSTWEIINPSDSDIETLEFPLSSSDSDTDSLSLSLSRNSKKPPPILIQRFGCCNYYDRRIECHMDGQDEFENDDDDDDDDDEEVDDELVPKGVVLERNRMRKLGKRDYSKMTKSKKLPIVYNRPGCVRGKHGLGLKHSLM